MEKKLTRDFCVFATIFIISSTFFLISIFKIGLTGLGVEVGFITSVGGI